MASKVAGYIGKIEKNGDWVAIGSTAYGVCDTAANVAEKVVDMKGFELVTGATVFVKFVHENTAQNPTVNVNETGAKGIISADNSPVSAWLDGAVLALTFDGNNWATSGDPSGSAIDEAISTVSGSLITLTDAADAPVADLTVAIEPVQSGEGGDPSPDNVRAITGWDACNVSATGKNLLNVNAYDAIQSPTTVTNGIVSITTANCYVQWIIPVKSGNYNMSYTVAGLSTGVSVFMQAYALDGTSMDKRAGKGNTDGTVSNYFTITDQTKVRIRIYTSATSETPVTISNIQLELGSSATTYEPYNGQTVTIDLGGTRYGGSLDVPTGVLTVNKISRTITSILAMDSAAGTPTQAAKILNDAKKGDSGIDILSDYLATKKTTYIAAHEENTIGVHTGSGYVYIKIVGMTSSADYNNYLSQHPLQVVYSISSPITYQLTPAEVRTILGLCNVWADTGNTSLTYFKTAGEGIAEAVSNASANAKYDDGQTRAMITQSSETAMVATKDYSEGDLVIIGGQLLRATENIATTTELVIGEDGNVEVVDLETVLKELSARISALEEE